MAEVADLFATLGLKVDAASWGRGDAAIGRAQRMAEELGRRFMGAGAALRGVPGGLHATGDAAEGAGRKAQAAAAGFDYLGTAIKGYLAYLGSHAIYEHFIKFNQDAQDRTIALAAMIEGSLGMSFEKATAQSKELYNEFQRFSQQTPVTTAEITEFAKNVAAATFAAGGKVKDLIEITEQGVIASKVLAGNRGAGYASLEITEMLMGNVSNRMMMVRQLLGAIHMTEEEFRGLDDKARLATVKRALSTPAFKDAGKAFQESFSGVTSTLEDKLQILGGTAGKPLFEALTKQVERLNGWIDKNKETIEAWAVKIGASIEKAFQKVVGVVEFLSEHTTLLKSIFIALGAIMAATAARAVIAWMAFLGPIGLIIAALAGIAYVVVEYWDDISEAMDDLWKGISQGASDLWEDLKAGFKAAFDFILSLPGIAELRDIMGWADQHSASSRDQATKDAETMTPAEWGRAHPDYDTIPQITNFKDSQKTLPADTSSGGPVAMNVDVGGITVSSSNADPVAVADEVNRTIGEHLGNVMRRTMDEVA